MTLFSAAATLLLIMDPFGNIVMFKAILSKIPQERRRKVLVREVLIAFGVLLLFLLVGAHLLSFLGLEQSSLSLAGGILLFLIAIGMVFPNRAVQLGVPGDDEPFIVPLAIPMIAVRVASPSFYSSYRKSRPVCPSGSLPSRSLQRFLRPF